MGTQDEISRIAVENYSRSEPWPDDDVWHAHTYLSEKKIIESWLSEVATQEMTILNAGSGGMEYETHGTIIHLDIIESYIKMHDNYIVGSVEKIDLPDESIDGIICVGSVLNYADAQRTISEFSRVLKPHGFFIIEFERSNSAEFLATRNHGKTLFSKDYHYNGQTHKLWLYNEHHIRETLKFYNLKVYQHKRIHTLSSLLNRFGIPEEKAAHFSRFDSMLQILSYPFAHNVLLLGAKEFSSK